MQMFENEASDQKAKKARSSEYKAASVKQTPPVPEVP